MDLPSINLIAVAVSAVSGFAFGAAYYTALGKQWMKAVGMTEADVKERRATPFITSFVSLLVTGATLACLFGLLGIESIGEGALVAALIWIGFYVPSTATNNSFQDKSWTLTVIDSCHWLGVLVIQALVIRAFG